jgi:hypothetical protein
LRHQRAVGQAGGGVGGVKQFRHQVEPVLVRRFCPTASHGKNGTTGACVIPSITSSNPREFHDAAPPAFQDR